MTKISDISIKKKIETVMTGNNDHECFFLGYFLSMASKIYGGGVKLRQKLYQKGLVKSKRLPCMVISVGNLSVGGTGKTPMTIYLANLIQDFGNKAVVISRGYKGRAEKAGGIVSDGKVLLMGPETAGDEPYMMAVKLKNVPVIVGKNRFEAGMLAVRTFKPEVLVLDDAFQHLKLERDLDLVLLDCHRPFGNGHMLPRGIMREPVSALSRADALILTRSDVVPDPKEAIHRLKSGALTADKPVFRAFHVPYIHKVIKGESSTSEEKSQSVSTCRPEFLKGRKAFVFSGLADNDNFHRTVRSLDCVVSGCMEFPDHHSYSGVDIENIFQSARQANGDCLVTTEKDYVRISYRNTYPVDLVVLGIKITFGDENDAFHAFIQSKLNCNGDRIPRNLVEDSVKGG
ncbi:MAG: tetraacyldisaccharide 4'-kinase [Deltaproteobacteria bacterium]|nr:tetraacyldisaccharide 4'-kinase [Deltaproteobacteria bacterium]